MFNFLKRVFGSEEKRSSGHTDKRGDALQIVEVSDEADRKYIHSELSNLIDDGVSRIEGYPPPVSEDRFYDYKIYGAYSEENGDLLGAIYAGPSHQTVINELRNSGGRNRNGWEQFLKDVFWIHAVATFVDQGKGVGTELLNVAEEVARESGFKLVLGVSDPKALPFYEKVHYKVSDVNQAVILKPTGQTPIGMPLTGTSRWIAKELKGGYVSFKNNSDIF